MQFAWLKYATTWLATTMSLPVRGASEGEDPGPEAEARCVELGDHWYVIAFPTVELDALPAVTAAQMRAVDRLMIEELGIDLPRMMENAGASLATLAIHAFEPRSVCVLVGRGGNGGGGLVAARHLANRGVGVTVVPSGDVAEFAPVPRQQLDILRRMSLDVVDEPARADLVVDALIGYSLHGSPRGRAAELIRWANGTGDPVMALDVPSGLDATTGEASEPCVRATATMTLALPKTGLRSAPDRVGRLYLADISVPPLVWSGIGVAPPSAFARSPIVELTP
jgi:NAD(P)H-hydrate epimerase